MAGPEASNEAGSKPIVAGLEADKGAGGEPIVAGPEVQEVDPSEKLRRAARWPHGATKRRRQAAGRTHEKTL